MYTLDNYIGNDHIKEELRIEIGAAKKRDVKLANILITGPYGSGKTMLARTIAHEADLPMMNLNSSLVKHLFKDVLDEIPNSIVEGRKDLILFEKIMVFFDEAHNLHESIQEMMLKVQLEKLVYVDGLWYDLNNVQWTYATTDVDKMRMGLRQRCELRYDLHRYTVMQMARILMRLVVEDKGKLLEVPIPAEVAHYVAQRSRFIPRIGEQYMERIYNIARNMADSPEGALEILDTEIAQQFFKRRRVTADGLTPTDFHYLRCLESSRKPMGVKTIAAQLEVNDAEVQKNVEPFLRHLNLINFTKSGREITLLGKSILGKFDSKEFTREQLDDLILIE